MHTIYMADATKPETGPPPKTPPPNPSLSLLWFFITTSIYFFLKMNTTSQLEKRIYLFVYVLVLIVGQFFINLSLSASICGVRQWQTALNVTAIPWFFIFGVLNMFLFLFPEWLGPFSNTFGYGLIRLMGINEFLDEILIPPFETTPNMDPVQKVVSQTLDHIYSDRSLLVNEISNVNTFWEKMKNLFKPGVYESKNSTDQRQNKLHSLTYYVNVKNYMSEFIWYMLSGILVTSVSYNYLVNMSCSRSVTQMTQQQKDYQAQQKINKNKQNAESDNDRVYSVTD
jgi:hypothetical protein